MSWAAMGILVGSVILWGGVISILGLRALRQGKREQSEKIARNIEKQAALARRYLVEIQQDETAEDPDYLL